MGAALDVGAPPRSSACDIGGLSDQRTTAQVRVLSVASPELDLSRAGVPTSVPQMRIGNKREPDRSVVSESNAAGGGFAGVFAHDCGGNRIVTADADSKVKRSRSATKCREKRPGDGSGGEDQNFKP